MVPNVCDWRGAISLLTIVSNLFAYCALLTSSLCYICAAQAMTRSYALDHGLEVGKGSASHETCSPSVRVKRKSHFCRTFKSLHDACCQRYIHSLKIRRARFGLVYVAAIRLSPRTIVNSFFPIW